MNKISKYLIIGGSFLAPALVFAQDIGSVLVVIQRILNTVIPILITIAVIVFIWGVIQYITAKEEEDQKKARSTMIYGIIGLFVIVAVWGLVGLLSRTFGITTGGSVPIPYVVP